MSAGAAGSAGAASVRAHLQLSEGFVPGVLAMPVGAAVWTPKEAGASLAINVVNIVDKGVKKSKPPNLLLAITEKSGASHIFRFDSDESRDIVYKHLLTPSVGGSSSTPAPQFSSRVAPATLGSPALIQSHLACREDLLARDPVLNEEYTTLVKVGKVVSEEDFWQGERAERLAEEYSRKQLSTGFAPSALVDGPSSGDAVSEEKKVLFSKEIMERIFVEYPGVLKVYENQVLSGKMDETQFWTAYLQSKYVLAQRRPDLDKDRQAAKQRRSPTDVAQATLAQEMFGSVDEYRLERGGLGPDERVVKPRMDPSIDLVRIQSDAQTTAVGGLGVAGYGLARRDGITAVTTKASAELARSLKGQGKALSKEDLAKVDEATAGSAPLLSLYNRRGTVALHPELKPVKNTKLPNKLAMDRDKANKLREERLREEFIAQATLDGDLSAPVKAYDAQPLPELVRPVKRVSTMDETAASGYPSLFAAASSTVVVVGAATSALRPPRLSEMRDDVRTTLVTELKAVEEMNRHFWRARIRGDRVKLETVSAKLKELVIRINVELREWLSVNEPRAVMLLRAPLLMLENALAQV